MTTRRATRSADRRREHVDVRRAGNALRLHVVRHPLLRQRGHRRSSRRSGGAPPRRGDRRRARRSSPRAAPIDRAREWANGPGKLCQAIGDRSDLRRPRPGDRRADADRRGAPCRRPAEHGADRHQRGGRPAVALGRRAAASASSSRADGTSPAWSTERRPSRHRTTVSTDRSRRTGSSSTSSTGSSGTPPGASMNSHVKSVRRPRRSSSAT